MFTHYGLEKPSKLKNGERWDIVGGSLDIHDFVPTGKNICIEWPEIKKYIY